MTILKRGTLNYQKSEMKHLKKDNSGKAHLNKKTILKGAIKQMTHLKRNYLKKDRSEKDNLNIDKSGKNKTKT